MQENETVKRKMRELGNLDKDNILVEEDVAKFGRGERAGGLAYYKDRQERLEVLGIRKKHGHLENMATGLMADVKAVPEKSKEEELLQRQLMNNKSHQLLQKNMDSMNLPA